MKQSGKIAAIVLTFALFSAIIQPSASFSISSWWENHVQEDPTLIRFRLFPDKRNSSFYEDITPGNSASLKASSYNPSLPVIVLIHGFISNVFGEFRQYVTQAYLDTNTKANIIFVDWSQLASPNAVVPVAFYHLAAANVPLAGETVAKFLIFLINEKALSGPKDVHLVGHSLGAHVSGFTGQNFLSLTGSLIQRITGLDPAGPEFLFDTDSKRLDSTDASFVDIIHTDMGQNGYPYDLGHVDFFPNGGGPSQPNCSYVSMFTGVCAHSTSYQYFAKSIRNPNIVACACDEYMPSDDCLTPCNEPVIFGEHCPSSARGDYYLEIYL